MFYILMLTGSGLILLGLNNRRIQKRFLPSAGFAAAEPVPASVSFDLEELEGRMEQLERLMFQSMVNREEEKAEAASEPVEAAAAGEPQVPKQPMPDNVRAVLDYESQGLSLQEIANITRMNKGEVLLLKNLSKHYSR